MIFAALSLLEWALLRRWHESAISAVLIGAVSRMPAMLTSPTSSAPAMYQAGARGEPVTVVSAATANCAVPPKMEIARA